jgi:hypothetical protein
MPEHEKTGQKEERRAQDDKVVVASCTYILDIPRSELSQFQAGQALIVGLLVATGAIAALLYFLFKVLAS